MKPIVTEDGDILVVSFSGEVDLEYSVHARKVLLDAVGRAGGVVVDLSKVSMIDSSGLASLLEAFQNARKRGKGFVLAGAENSIIRVFKLARLDTVFAIEDDVEAAKRTIR